MVRSLVIISIIISSSFFISWVTNPKTKNAGVIAVETNSGILPSDSQRVIENYRNFCGGCHGEKMDAFVDRVWKHGSDRMDLFKGIKSGYTDEGMPAFDSAFTD